MREEVKRQQGYTLTEILVALTVTALLSTFLFSALQWGASAWRVAEVSEQRERLDATQRLMRRLIESAELKFEVGKDGEQIPTFVGEATTLTFVGPAPAQVEMPGLYRLEFSVEPFDDEDALVLRRELFRPGRNSDDVNQLSSAQAYVLVREIYAIRFSYFGATENGGTPSWVDEWTAENSLPKLVRVEIDTSSGDKYSWPTFTVAPKLQF